jgi:ferredoxin
MRIKVHKDRCSGCRLCRQICAIEHFNEINPAKAAIRIEAQFPQPGKYRPYVCIQCGKCAEACPEKAISQNEIGAYIVDIGKCNNCGECVSVCPQGVVFKHPEVNHVIICNFCMKCTQLCNTGAIVQWEKREKASAEEAVHG